MPSSPLAASSPMADMGMTTAAVTMNPTASNTAVGGRTTWWRPMAGAITIAEEKAAANTGTSAALDPLRPLVPCRLCRRAAVAVVPLAAAVTSAEAAVRAATVAVAVAAGIDRLVTA